MIKLLEKEENEEKYLEEQWSHVLSDFNKKTSIGMYIEEWRDCEKNLFLLERRGRLAKMLEREAELEKNSIIKDVYEKYLHNWKRQLFSLSLQHTITFYLTTSDSRRNKSQV